MLAALTTSITEHAFRTLFWGKSEEACIRKSSGSTCFRGTTENITPLMATLFQTYFQVVKPVLKNEVSTTNTGMYKYSIHCEGDAIIRIYVSLFLKIKK
jgi:tRNA(His) 5'-end guanylyltransferase